VSRLNTKARRIGAQKRPDMGQLMTLAEVAVYLQIAERTVYHWAQTGRLPGFKLGAVWRFKRDDVEHWIEEQKLSTERRQAVRRSRMGRTSRGSHP